MNEDQQSSRATKIVTSKEQQEIQQVIDELQSSQHVNAFFVLSKFIDCSDIKNEPEFCQILFEEHPDVVAELIEWMLLPKLIIKGKKIKTNVDSYPYQCREFMKDNWCFYQQMYIASRNKKLDFRIWFNFLRKQFYDKDTIHTALGYFADVMIPFAKYQFSGSFNLSKSLQVSAMRKNVETLSIMKILPEQLINQLVTYCHYEPIFKFLKTSILVSIDDPRDYQISKLAALKLLKGSNMKNIFAKFPIASIQINDEVAKTTDYLSNIATCLKELIQNIQPNSSEFSFRNTALIESILESNIIKDVVEQLTKSRLCGMVSKQKNRLHSSVSNSTDVVENNHNGVLSVSVQYSQNSQNNNLNVLPSIGSLPIMTDADEEQIVEVLFKILSASIEIFMKIPKSLNFHDNQSLEASQQHINGEGILLQPSQNAPKPKPKQITYEQYSAMMGQYRQQLQYLLANMEVLTKFVYNQAEANSASSRVIPFATGENVKAISMMKWEFFKLLYNCLAMVQLKDSQNLSNPQAATVVSQEPKEKQNKLKKAKSITFFPFQIRIQKIHPLQIIKKYLIENKWNNLVHHVLQKICHLLIVGSYDYIKKNLQKDEIKKFSDSFLSYLIENFTKRDFIFLNTVKFTTQGNLHSLYNIARDLAYTLNSTNQLVVYLNQFEPWKKFIMTDLKGYQQKTFPVALKPQFYQKDDEQARNIKVDEVDSIKKLIQNISQAPLKWPIRTKTDKKKSQLSKSGIFRFGDYNSSGLTASKQTMKLTGGPSTAKKQDQNTQASKIQPNSLQAMIRKKIQENKLKQVKQFDIDQKNFSVGLKKSESIQQFHKQIKSQTELLGNTNQKKQDRKIMNSETL